MVHRSAKIGRCSMTECTTRKTVTFTWPFLLSGIGEIQPAGTYIVETNEELLQEVSFAAYRRIESLLFLPARPGGVFVERAVKIDHWSGKKPRAQMLARAPPATIHSY